MATRAHVVRALQRAILAADDHPRPAPSVRGWLSMPQTCGVAGLVVGALLACLLTAFANQQPASAADAAATAGPAALAAGFGRRLLAAAEVSLDQAPAIAYGLMFMVGAVLLAVPLRLARLLSRPRRAHEGASPTPHEMERTALVTGFSRPRRAWLERAEGEPAGRVDLGAAVLRIGSAPDNELAITDAGLGSYHAAIVRTPEHDIYLDDLTRGGGTADGMTVNGEPRRHWRLRDGDRIALGGVQFIYRTASL